MRITDILDVLENDQLPHRIRCMARALLIAMLALDKYGHTLSYGDAIDGRSEADQDRGRIARAALDDIRDLERHPARQQLLSRLVQQRRSTLPKRLRRLLAKHERQAAPRRSRGSR